MTILLSVNQTCFGANFTLSKGIKNKLRDKIENDLRVLNNFTFLPPQAETLKLLGIESLNPDTANLWLEERVKYVIEENALSKLRLTLSKVIFVEKENVTYPFQNIIPYSIEGQSKNESSEKNNDINDEKDNEGIVIMANVGTAIYMAGKSEKKVYGIKISRGIFKSDEKVIIDSPRSGVIQIGEGLFGRTFTVNKQSSEAVANSIHRLSIFFHEARHSDGHGKSLGFAHAICPVGHDFEGQPACDESLNGAYAVGSSMMVEMVRSCGDRCTEREKETMRLIILDNKNRILPKTHKDGPAQNWDVNPESL